MKSLPLFCFVLLHAVLWAGPRTAPTEFFTKHLDTSSPALAGIPAKVQAGDLAGAEKIFADTSFTLLLAMERRAPAPSERRRGLNPQGRRLQHAAMKSSTRPTITDLALFEASITSSWQSGVGEMPAARFVTRVRPAT